MPARATAGQSGQTRVCFVTGTRAEFGLMRSTLQAIREHPKLELKVLATGMHLDPAHGDPAKLTKRNGVDGVVPWPADSGKDATATAVNTGAAIAGLARAYRKLRPDVVLVTGDRVEAFAAASAGHLCHIPVAHVHGGDRALGLVDDSLRHAITKLAHVHFPATEASAKRIAKLGEDAWRIHRVGSPGIDGIVAEAASRRAIAEAFPGLVPNRFALLILHPASPDAGVERDRARMLFGAVEAVGFDRVVVVYPNNDPGSKGILSAWKGLPRNGRVIARPDVPRGLFLGLLREAAVLVGNSSSGIIEAASFGTPVVDVGPRQLGRERSRNVVHCDYETGEIGRRLRRVWNGGKVRRFEGVNVYGGEGTGRRIAEVLAALSSRGELLRKLISY